jgi:hypothetical protein
VEAMGYKNIMNLPDFQNTGYRAIKQEMQAVPAWKFLPGACFLIALHSAKGRYPSDQN